MAGHELSPNRADYVLSLSDLIIVGGLVAGFGLFLVVFFRPQSAGPGVLSSNGNHFRKQIQPSTVPAIPAERWLKNLKVSDLPEIASVFAIPSPAIAERSPRGSGREVVEKNPDRRIPATIAENPPLQAALAEGPASIPFAWNPLTEVELKSQLAKFVSSAGLNRRQAEAARQRVRSVQNSQKLPNPPRPVRRGARRVGGHRPQWIALRRERRLRVGACPGPDAREVVSPAAPPDHEHGAVSPQAFPRLVVLSS